MKTHYRDDDGQLDVTLSDDEVDIIGQALFEYHKAQIRAHRSIIETQPWMTEQDFAIPKIAKVLQDLEPYL